MARNNMRLLVITQKIDKGDDVLGFFHEWVRGFAGRCDTVEVICLYEGAHGLPANVHVHSLGKEQGVSRATYIGRLIRYVWFLRYDSVFVHMNEEYVLLCGPWWRLSSKRVVMWRNHKMGSWRTRLAVWLSNKVCFTSPGAFVARYKKSVRMPIGIDTDFFSPPPTPAPRNTILFLGRLDPVKKVEDFVTALKNVGHPFKADLYGSPTNPASPYPKRIADMAQSLIEEGKLTLHPGVPFLQTPDLYRSHALYVNLTPSGSFDKTIGEAMACGCIVICANEALRGNIPSDCLVADGPSCGAAMERITQLPENERASHSRANRDYIEREHSLRRLLNELGPQL